MSADVVANLAGLTPPEPKPLTPAFLIERYCTPSPTLDSLVSSSGTEARPNCTISRGFIGWMGGDYGYDDGYTFMDALMSGGWKSLAECGDWPYVVYMVWPARESDPRYAIASYVEGDFTCTVYTDKDAAKAGLAQLRNDSPAP